MRKLYSCFFLIFLLVPSTFQYNYLVFCPLFGHSHTTFLARIADILAEAGHHVTFFTPTIVSEFRNISYTKLTKDVVHLDPSPELKFIGDLIATNKRWWDKEFSIFEVPQTGRFFNSVTTAQHNVLANSLEVLDDLKKRKFDLLIFEPIFTCAFPMMEYLEIPAFATALSLTFESTSCKAIGEPVMPSFVPSIVTQSSDRMTRSERFLNTAIHFLRSLYPLPETYTSYKNPGTYINVEQVYPLATFFFLNSNPYLEFPRPTLAKNIQIGGISVDIETLKSGKLNEEWDGILNLRNKTMLISFGTVIMSKDMPSDKKQALVSAMKKFPDVTFIWKYEDDNTDEFAKGVENIHFSKWVPQRELLADSRLTVFMTHGGLGSVNEVSYLGKPTIMCPIFGDQMRNTKMLVRHNGSIEISKYDLSNSQIVEQIFRKILYDPSYAQSAKRLAEHLENQPVKPKDLFLKHAEFAARFGTIPSLDPASREMSFIEYFLLDLAAILIVFATAVLFILAFVIRKILNIVIVWSGKQKND